MDRREAARVLGVAPDAGPEEARAAFRLLIRSRHPDRAGPGGHADSARLIEAHRVMRRAASPGPAPRPGAGHGVRATRPDRPVAPPVDARVEGDALLVSADPVTVMAAVVEAGATLGEITYLDRSSGFAEILLQVREEGDDRPAACSMVTSLQGRLDAVEVFCTVERLDGHPPPPIAPLVSALADAMRAGRS